jgi:hypothetical protein
MPAMPPERIAITNAVYGQDVVPGQPLPDSDADHFCECLPEQKTPDWPASGPAMIARWVARSVLNGLPHQSHIDTDGADSRSRRRATPRP